MNWKPTDRQRFRCLRKQGEGLTVRGGCIYGDPSTVTTGTYFVWLKDRQPYLMHESYYTGEELYFIQAERDPQL